MSITHADGRTPEMRRMDALEKRVRWLEVLAGVNQQPDYPGISEEAAALATLPTATKPLDKRGWMNEPNSLARLHEGIGTRATLPTTKEES